MANLRIRQIESTYNILGNRVGFSEISLKQCGRKFDLFWHSVGFQLTLITIFAVCRIVKLRCKARLNKGPLTVKLQASTSDYNRYG